MGPIGLKRAEKDLIMRRYKGQYHPSENLNRVALIYGQQNGGQNQGGGYYVPGSNVGGGNSQNSPYLVSVGSDSMAGNLRHGQNNAVNIIRRSKNFIEDIKNQNSGYQVRLPKINNMNRQNPDYMMSQLRRQGQQGVFPPIIAGQGMGPGGS